MTLDQVVPGFIQFNLENLQRWREYSDSGQLPPMFHSLHIKKGFLYILSESPFFQYMH